MQQINISFSYCKYWDFLVTPPLYPLNRACIRVIGNMYVTISFLLLLNGEIFAFQVKSKTKLKKGKRSKKKRRSTK